jgi:parallel beta-helix repeat protein
MRIPVRLVLVLAGFAACWPASAVAIPTGPVTCGEVVTHSVRLAGDVICNDFRNALVVGADGVTIDLAGHRVEAGPLGGPGSGAVGVDNSGGFDGVTVRHGSIGGLDGIEAVDARHNRFVDLRAAGGYGSGIIIERGSDNVVKNSQVSGRFGIYVPLESDRIRIVGNSVGTGFGDAITVNSNSARIARNTVEGSFFGVALSGSHSRVVGNIARRNAVNIVVAGTDNLVARNQAIEAKAGPDELPPPNGDGIFIDSTAVRTVVRRNLATGNNDDGIDVESPSTTVTRNTANDNGDLGIDAVAGVIDLGGNAAAGNGNPLQCLNVVCR